MLASMCPPDNGCQGYPSRAVSPCATSMENVRMGNGLKQLGRAIRARRLALGINQERLAELTAFEQSSISRIERGEQDISQSGLLTIAKALGTSLSALWAEAEGLPAPESVPGPMPGERDLVPVLHAIAAALIATIPAAAEPLRAGLQETPEGTVLLALLDKLPPTTAAPRVPKTPGVSGKSRPRGGS